MNVLGLLITAGIAAVCIYLTAKDIYAKDPEIPVDRWVLTEKGMGYIREMYETRWKLTPRGLEVLDLIEQDYHNQCWEELAENYEVGCSCTPIDSEPCDYCQWEILRAEAEAEQHQPWGAWILDHRDEPGHIDYYGGR